MSSILVCDICNKQLKVGDQSVPTKIQIGSEVFEFEDTCQSCVSKLRGFATGNIHALAPSVHVKQIIQEDSMPLVINEKPELESESEPKKYLLDEDDEPEQQERAVRTQVFDIKPRKFN